MKATFITFTVLLLLVLNLALVGSPAPAGAQNAQEIERLQNEINERNQRLDQIEEEIKEYESALQEVGAERESLEQAIRQLELERSKIQADIRKTQNRIDTADLTIGKLAREIRDTQNSIDNLHEALTYNLQIDSQTNKEPLILALLGRENLSDFWVELDSRQTLQTAITEQVNELQSLQEVLTDKQEATESQKNQLVQLKNQYEDQTAVLANNREEQTELLSATRSEEESYQELLARKRAARDQIIAEMRDFESELQFILDPTTVPQPGSQVFDWPLENIVITQLFGGTEFAKRNASVYAGRAYHPGVDFGAPRGTPIHAPLSGTVRATGNTDAVSGCYSWGKWTLVDHSNGLSTLYAHQDLISVTPGESVKTGEIIGYTGNTGFSTGPHLHFTVYATEAVQVRNFSEIRASTSCAGAKTPTSATEGYLDPLQYLPPQ